MKPPRLTFKREPKETGLAGVARPHQDVQIKADGKEVGQISAASYCQKHWSVRLMVEDVTGWKWVSFKARFDNEDDARQFVKEHWAQICQRYTFHTLEID